LQSGRDTIVFPVAHLRRVPQPEQEKVLTLNIRQHQGPRDTIEHIRRWRTATPLFEPRVPG
jgi:hypothetical protein